MASQNLLNILATGPQADPGVFSTARVRGEQIRRSQEESAQNQRTEGQRNVLFQQGQEDRQRGLQQEQESKQLEAVREDLAMFLMLPDDNARTQAWQGGLAQHYKQDPATPWQQAIGSFVRQNPGVLGKATDEVLKRHFAPDVQQPTAEMQNFAAEEANPAFAARRNELKTVGAQFRVDNRPPDAPPSGYRRTATGMEFEPGGPADPANPLNQKKLDEPSRYTPKEMSTARSKLLAIQVAQQQLTSIKDNWVKLAGEAKDGKRAGAISAGPFFAGKIPTEEGNNFDKAVDRFRGSLTALKRVPGVGAMSDYETRLDQAGMPNRGDYESATEETIEELQAYLDALSSGYGDIVGQEGLAPPAPPPPAPGNPTTPKPRVDANAGGVQKWGRDANGNPVRL